MLKGVQELTREDRGRRRKEEAKQQSQEPRRVVGRGRQRSSRASTETANEEIKYGTG